MGKKLVTGGLVLIGLYLALSYATGGGKLLTATFDGTGNLVKRLQGR